MPIMRFSNETPAIRVGLRYRALAVDVDGGYLWFWIGSHADYDKMIG
jgi:hypothetical protein